MGVSGYTNAGSIIFDNLEVGATVSEIMDWFHLTHQQVMSVIEFAARSLDTPPVSNLLRRSMLILFENGTARRPRFGTF